MSDTLVMPDTEETTETDDPIVAHVARKEDVTRSYITGEPLEALCGIIFVPHRDPENYPVCQKCQNILKQIQNARKGNN